MWYDCDVLAIEQLRHRYFITNRKHDYQLKLNIPKNDTRVVQMKSFHCSLLHNRTVNAQNKWTDIGTRTKNISMFKMKLNEAYLRKYPKRERFRNYFLSNNKNISQGLIFCDIWTKISLKVHKIYLKV